MTCSLLLQMDERLFEFIVALKVSSPDVQPNAGWRWKSLLRLCSRMHVPARVSWKSIANQGREGPQWMERRRQRGWRKSVTYVFSQLSMHEAGRHPSLGEREASTEWPIKRVGSCGSRTFFSTPTGFIIYCIYWSNPLKKFRCYVGRKGKFLSFFRSFV